MKKVIILIVAFNLLLVTGVFIATSHAASNEKNKISTEVQSLCSLSLLQQEQNGVHKEEAKRSLSIRGRILDSRKKPLERAIISIDGLKVTAKTERTGRFSLDNLAPGNYRLKIEKPGYNTYISDPLILENRDSELEIVLLEMVKEEIVVTATRTEIPLKEVPVRTELITSEEIQNSGSKTVYDALNKIPVGVWVQQSCTSCNYAELRIQGLEGGYSQVLIDGEPVFSGLANVYSLQQLGTVGIQQIEIVKGASSALYGAQAVAGVVNIITKEPSFHPEAAVDFTYGSFQTYEISAEGSVRKDFMGITASARKGISDFVDTNHDNFSEKVLSETLNLFVKSNFYFAQDMHRISLIGRYIDEYRKGGYIPNLDDEFDPLSEHITTRRYEYGLGYQGLFKQNRLLKINAIGIHHTLAATNLARPFDSEENTAVVNIQYTHALTDRKHRITGGITYKNERIDEAISGSTSEKKGGETVGFYIQDEIERYKNKDVVVGIRFDRTQSTFITASSFSPRIAMRWVINPEFTFRFNVGSGFRVPYFFTEDLHLCSCAPLIYNPGNLKPERSLSLSMSGEYSANKLFVEINIFRTAIRKKIYFTRQGAPNGFDFIYVNGSGAYSQGIEGEGRYEFSRMLDLNFGFTLNDARYTQPQDYSIGRSRMIMRTPFYAGIVNLKYTHPATAITASLSGHLTGNMYIENYVERRIDKTAPFTTWNIIFQKQFNNKHLMLAAGIDNIFNYIQKVIYNPLLEQGSTYVYAPLVGRYMYVSLKLSK